MEWRNTNPITMSTPKNNGPQPRSTPRKVDPHGRTRPDKDRPAPDVDHEYDPVGMAGKKAGIVKKVEADLKKDQVKEGDE